jgi:hypothetical protein
MEYLSLPHTRASSHKLVPDVDDGLLTNLRNPILTLIEDTSPGAHDTLTAACDANLYTALGVDAPEEHGSCAENLVLALKELNEGAGLKGTKAIGADITVNIAPTPLHLFMNAPLDTSNISSIDGAGAKGALLTVDEPKRQEAELRALPRRPRCCCRVQRVSHGRRKTEWGKMHGCEFHGGGCAGGRGSCCFGGKHQGKEASAEVEWGGEEEGGVEERYSRKWKERRAGSQGYRTTEERCRGRGEEAGNFEEAKWDGAEEVGEEAE